MNSPTPPLALEGPVRAGFPPQLFLDALEGRGFDFFTGIPCSYFDDVIRILDAEPRYGYVSAVREDSALGVAAGAYLGGRMPVVFMQNSGFGVSVNALLSLNQIYDIPALLVISWRGQNGLDAPEHLHMGRKLTDLLDLLEVPFQVLDLGDIDRQLLRLTDILLRTHKPVALLVSKGTLGHDAE